METKGAYPAYDVYLEITIDGTIEYTKHWDKLEPWEIYSFNSGEFSHPCIACGDAGQPVNVDVRGKTPWGEDLTAHDYRDRCDH